MIEPTDWRLNNQAQYLAGAVLVWNRYVPANPDNDHDHCEFCWAKFMDPTYSDAHRAHIEQHPEVVTEGYATTAAHPKGADYHWVCAKCFDDLAESFGWRVADRSA